MFKNTKIIKKPRSKSILIKFDENKGISELILPVGLDEFPDTYESKKELFFQTYHSYRKFISEKKIELERRNSSKSEKRVEEEDTVYDDHKLFQFKDTISGETITYQKLVMFDSVLDAYDEFKIQSLQDKISRSDTIDYSKLHKYIHQAIFIQPDNTMYIDEIDRPKKIINDATTEIVEMFCYIYSEINKEFGVSSINNRVESLANNFRENRLYEEASLFAEDTYDDTMAVLKEVLEEIDRLTPYKDFDYWHFYDAIYNFIYANNDGCWELDNFSFIWERMCMAFAKKYYKEQISLYDKFGTLVEGSDESCYKSIFKVSINRDEENNIVRFIRPDLLMKDTDFAIEEDFLERIYVVSRRGGEIDLSYNREHDIRNYYDIDKLKKELFKDKYRIKSFFENTGRFPPTFTLTPSEYDIFKEKALFLLRKRGYFELACRHPIIVKLQNKSPQYKSYLVVDFKYIGENAFGEILDPNISKTVRKQLVYELAVKLNLSAHTRSEFWIPSYISSRFEDVPKVIRRYAKNCDPFFRKYRISIIQLDFLTLQQIYIQDDFRS